MPLHLLGITGSDGLMTEGFVDDVISEITVISVSPTGIPGVGTTVPDAGGRVVTATGFFPLGVGVSVTVSDGGSLNVLCYSGIEGAGEFAQPSADGSSLSFVVPKLPEGGPYDLLFTEEGGLSSATLLASLTVVHRSYANLLYTVRAQVGDPRDPGPRSMALEDFGSSAVPDDLLEALISAMVDEMWELAGFIQTRTLSPFTSGDAVLAVESTDRWADAGSFAAPEGLGVYTGKTSTSLTGVVADFDIAPNSPVVDVTRSSTGIDSLRRAYIIDTASDAELDVIGRNYGCPRPIGMASSIYRGFLKVAVFGRLQTTYALELALDALVGPGLYEIWEDPADPGTVYIQIPLTGGGGSLEGRSYFIGLEPVVLPTDLGSTLTVLHTPVLPYGVYAESDPGRHHTNYAMELLANTVTLEPQAYLGRIGDRENLVASTANNPPFSLADVGKGVIVVNAVDGVSQSWTVADVISSDEIKLIGSQRFDALLQGAFPTEIRSPFPVFKENMPGQMQIEISNSPFMNDGLYDIATVESPYKATLVGANFTTEVNAEWRLVPMFLTAGALYIVQIFRATFDAGLKQITTPVPLRKGFFAWNYADFRNELDPYIMDLTGEPVVDNGAMVADTGDFGQLTDFDSAHSGARTYMFRYKALVDGGVATKHVIRGTADGAGDDGLEVFIDWSSASALRVRLRDAAGATIYLADFAFKPIVGVTYWIMFVADFGGSGDGYVRVYIDGSSTVVFSGPATAIAAGQSWTSSHVFGVASTAGATPSTDTELRGFLFFPSAISDGAGGSIADGSSALVGAIWHFLKPDDRKPEDTFRRGTYLVDYTTARQDSHIIQGLGGPKFEGSSPLYWFDFGAVSRSAINKILAAGIISRVITE